jgi:UDPglucose 6-dehydrogenase
VVSNPEFLKEGAAVEDFMKPDRVVIGSEDERATQIMRAVYAPLQRNHERTMVMDVRSAELTKYAANAFLATKISFMNEIAQICERLGADVDMVRKGIGSDERIGKRFLFPGIGYGGSCFPKDVKALVYSAKEVKYEFQILNAVTEVNEKQKSHLVTKIRRYFGDLKGKHFAIWGLAFKPNTDDIREAPALEIMNTLLAEGATVSAFDPEAMNNVKNIMGDRISFADTQYDCLENADALIIATEWNEFRTPDFEKMTGLLKDAVIFDGRNLFDVESMEKKGFHYESIGRPLVNQPKFV